MALVLPSTVEELNFLQTTQLVSRGYSREISQAFENITIEKKYKREVSLPNGVQNWGIRDFESYLNFDNNAEGLVGSADDRLVPEEGGDQRDRCGSISSVSSNMDEKRVVFHNVKTINTVCIDSGSTCISSDHSYISSNTTCFQGLDPEETYQNLNTFFHEVPEITNTDTLSSSFSSAASPMSHDSNFELVPLLGTYTPQDDNDDDAVSFASTKTSRKRSLADTYSDDLFDTKRQELEFIEDDGRYHEIRRKNNLASKNCRKTRKEKQDEMNQKVQDLEKEREDLKVEVQVLEQLIHAHKIRLYAILQKR